MLRIVPILNCHSYLSSSWISQILFIRNAPSLPAKNNVIIKIIGIIFSPSFILEVFEIVLSRGYGENNLRDDIKSLYVKLGIENKKIIFLFTDAHVAEEGFLELINNMLTSGNRERAWSPTRRSHTVAGRPLGIW